MALTRPTSTTSTSADDPGGVSLAGLFDEYADAIEALGTPGVDYPAKATVTLSSAQILDLHNTPITLVAAPGAGKYIQLHRYLFDYVYGTTDYVAGDGLYLYYGADAYSTGVDLTASINTSNSVYLSGAAATSLSTSVSSLGNLPVKATAFGVAIAGGDGTLTITVWYSIEDVPA